MHLLNNSRVRLGVASVAVVATLVPMAAWATNSLLAGRDSVPSAVAGTLVMPYQAMILDDKGIGVDGTFDVDLHVYDVADQNTNSEMLLLERSYPGLEVSDGLLSLGVELDALSQTGPGLSPEILLERISKDLEVQLFLDGEEFGERHKLGSVPYAASAGRVNAASVEYGGEAGYVRSLLVTRNAVVEEFVAYPGDPLPAEPAGFTCVNSADVLSGGTALEFAKEISGSINSNVSAVFWDAIAGCGTLEYERGISVDIQPDGNSPVDFCDRLHVYAMFKLNSGCSGGASSCVLPVDALLGGPNWEKQMLTRVTRVCEKV